MDSDISTDDSGNESSEYNYYHNYVVFEPKNQRDKHRLEDYPFEVLTTEQILQHMNECIEEVRNYVELPSTVIRMLLNHFCWDKEKLVERFYDDSGNQEKLFTEAHIVNPLTKAVVSSPESSDFCQICLLTQHSSEMSRLECGHRFCKPCWTEYLTLKILSEGMNQTISCAAHNCDTLIDDSTVMKLVTDSKVRAKYQHLIINGFVKSNRYLRWCPSLDCSRVIRVKHVESRPVTCSCGRTFCFECGNHWHGPIGCAMLLSWMAECDEDSGTSDWIVANTKECPKCKAIIEKIGGCNRMICLNVGCNEEFCWGCLLPWKQHSQLETMVHRYNRSYEDPTNCQSQNRAALQRFTFYRNRFMIHKQHFQMEHELRASVKVKMEKMQKNNMLSVEVGFMKKAVDILCQCRQTLMYTYVFAYYLKKSNQSVIFEYNQKDLESSTEKLSEYLKRDITEKNLVDFKQKLQNQYQYCELQQRALTEHAFEGYEKGWWEYNK